MIAVLYVNHAHSEVCGVHDLGRRHARSIAAAADVDLDYVEVNDIDHYHQALEARGYDVVVVNYMPGIMPWVTAAIRRHDIPTIAVIHNYQHDTIDRVTAAHRQMFDFVLALDPTLTTANPWVLVTDRPLPATVPPVALSEVPRIGTFGFAFPHKGFAAVAAEVAATFDEAILDLHMPEAYFNGAHGAMKHTAGILAQIGDALSDKPGIITVNHTTGHLDPAALTARLAANHVNCLFYVPGQHNAGLSSALDYLVAARRPIMVTDCAMFAHYRNACAIYPGVRLTQVFGEQKHWAAAVTRTYIEASDAVAEQTAGHLRRVA